MLPMMGGMLLTSIASGQLISRTGRYKVFPVVGTAIMSLGLFLLSRMSAQTSTLAASGIMLVMGLGLGLVMQVLVIAVQNAVEYKDLGVATSGATLFRLIGGSVGTAVLGAIFASRLATELVQRLPPGTEGASAPGAGITTAMLAALPHGVRLAYSDAFSASLSVVFVVATMVALVGFVLAWMLPERPLRASISAEAKEAGGLIGEGFAMPVSPNALAELRRGLSALANRDAQRGYIEELVREAGVDLTPAAAWLLVRFEQEPGVDVASLGRAHAVEAGKLEAAIILLANRRLITVRGAAENGGRRFGVTPPGCEVLGRLIAVRRARIDAAASQWDTDEMRVASLKDFGRELVPDAHPSDD
jgi:hypothetical protein